jgi:FkbM family methyltransferase
MSSLFKKSGTNQLADYADVFNGITPWDGYVPQGYLVDFLGVLTDARFRAPFGLDPSTVGGGHVQTRLPTIADGEGWFEDVNWVVSAREARGRYVMATLGACYGSQAVGSCRALQLLNPMPYKLIALEPDPDNHEWTRRHMRDNGIDPDAQWILQMAISDGNAPVLFPVGSPGSGANNCVATNQDRSRRIYASEIIASGRAEEAVRNLLINNSTGITKDLVPGENFLAEIKLVSAVSLDDILAPFDFIDYLESDIQQSEIVVFPPAMEGLKRKVRRIHIGTHGQDVHWTLHKTFEKQGWQIIFSYEPNAKHESALGSFTTNDGVLTVRNPLL